MTPKLALESLNNKVFCRPREALTALSRSFIFSSNIQDPIIEKSYKCDGNFTGSDIVTSGYSTPSTVNLNDSITDLANHKVECRNDYVLNEYKLNKTGSNFSYSYKCLPTVSKGSCVWVDSLPEDHLPYISDKYPDGDIRHLDEYPLVCPEGKPPFIAGFELKTYANNMYGYSIKCCNS